ncbi:MAG: DUF6588 family protein [Bacteriovoracaceae bacterium]
MKKTLLSILLAVVLLMGSAFAQTEEEGGFEGTLKKLAGDAGKGFVQPVVSGFGNNMNGGWFHKAPGTKIFGIDLEVGLVAMGTFTTDENKKFSTKGSFRFSGGKYSNTDPLNPVSKSQAEGIAEKISNWGPLPANEKQAIIDAISNTNFNVGIAGPTVVGTKQDTMKITFDPTLFSYTSPNTGASASTSIPGSEVALQGVTGVLDGAAMIPLAAPQFSIGTIYGTQATFRYLPEIEISKDLGKFKYFGFGIQHNLGMWLPIPIVDVAASFFTQKLEVGTIMEANTTSFGINAAKQFGFAFLNVTPYAGFMFESSKMKFGYDYTYTSGATNTIVTDRISFELEGENTTRLTVGLGLRILVININVDYNIGKQNSATAGVFFAF